MKPEILKKVPSENLLDWLLAMYIGFCAVSYGSLMARRWKRLTENKRWLLPLGLAANIIYLFYYL